MLKNPPLAEGAADELMQELEGNSSETKTAVGWDYGLFFPECSEDYRSHNLTSFKKNFVKRDSKTQLR